MSALKKKYIFHNISTFLEENLLVFFFNYNHIYIEEWRIIKNELSKIKRVNTLVVKNQIGNNVIKKNTGNKTKQFEKLSTLFQGPTFLIGISCSEECIQVFNSIKKQQKLIFVGGLYQSQLINHLDVKYLLKVENRANTSLITFLQSTLYLTPITTNFLQFLFLLKCYQNNKM